MNSEQLDKMILEKLGGYLEDPSPDLFQSVLSERERSAKTKKYTKILLVAAGAIVLAILLYVLMKVLGNDGQGSVLYPSSGQQVSSTGTSNNFAGDDFGSHASQSADQAGSLLTTTNGISATATNQNNKRSSATSNRKGQHPVLAKEVAKKNTGKDVLKNKTAVNAQKDVTAPEQLKTLSLQAHFTYLVDSNGNVRFFNQSTHPEPARYEWSFSDGKTSVEQDATHRFASNGVYHVCLSVITESGRFDNDCQEVYIENLPTRKNIVGKVSAGGMIPERGWAYLIRYDSLLLTPYLIDSMKLDDVGYFAFTSLPEGYYLVRATMENGSSMYKDYLPTYYGQSLVWNAANRYNTGALARKTSEMLVINMIPVHAHPQGEEVIRDDTNQPDPLGQKMMVLYDDKGNPIGFTYADPQGNYQFDKLPPGKYKVFDPATGRYTSYTKGSDKNNTPPPGTTAPPASGNSKQPNDPGTTAPQELIISPNPCTQASSVSIRFDNAELSYAHVSIINMQNAQVMREGTVQRPSIKQEMSFDVMYLAPGTYSVRVDKGNGKLLTGLLIK